MSFSKEYTDWHLTPSGWVPGDARIDFGTFFNLPIPNDRVLTIRYEEVMSSAFSRLEKSEEIIYSSDDTKTINDLRVKYPIKFHIISPD